LPEEQTIALSSILVSSPAVVLDELRHKGDNLDLPLLELLLHGLYLLELLLHLLKLLLHGLYLLELLLDLLLLCQYQLQTLLHAWHGILDIVCKDVQACCITYDQNMRGTVSGCIHGHPICTSFHLGLGPMDDNATLDSHLVQFYHQKNQLWQLARCSDLLGQAEVDSGP
jgi:hypothetical protein